MTNEGVDSRSLQQYDQFLFHIFRERISPRYARQSA